MINSVEEQLEELLTLSNNLAPKISIIYMNYYKEFIKAGFTEQQAFELTKGIQVVK